MTGTTPAPRRERPRLPPEERLSMIIDAATALIAVRGFWGLSMKEVADRCGLTVPGLLHHVGSKTGLLVAVLRHRDIEDSRALRAYLAVDEQHMPDEWSDTTPSGVDLRELCSATMRRNAGQPEIVRLFAVLEAESLDRSHPAHDYFAARQQRVVSVFTALAAGTTPHPEKLARNVVAMMDGLQLQWLRAPDATDLVALWEQAAGVLFRPSENR